MKSSKGGFSMTVMMLIVFLVMIGLFKYSMSSFVDEFKSEEQEYKDVVGKHLVLKGDTLMIMDFSMFMETFTLDNGTTVSKAILDNNEVVD